MMEAGATLCLCRSVYVESAPAAGWTPWWTQRKVVMAGDDSHHRGIGGGIVAALRTDARVVRRHSKADTIVTGLSVLAFADERVWLSLLVQFACIYGEIHEALVRAAETNEAIRLLLQHRFKLTDRREAFARDVHFFQKRVTQTPTDAHARVHAETLRYVAHIRETCEKEPVLAVVFAHTMLMALMAGGAILRRMQRASMGLPRYVMGQAGDATRAEAGAGGGFRFGAAGQCYQAGRIKSLQADGAIDQSRWGAGR